MPRTLELRKREPAWHFYGVFALPSVLGGHARPPNKASHNAATTIVIFMAEHPCPASGTSPFVR